MSNRVLIGCSAPFVLGMLVAAVLVWVAVLKESGEQPPDPRVDTASQQTGGAAEAGSGDDAQAEARRVLEQELAAQEEFEARMAESRRAQKEGRGAAPENHQAAPEPDEGGGGEEAPIAVASQATDTSSVVTATTCNGASIELYEGEKRMLDLHNQTRAEHGLTPLCVHPALTNAARDHSRDMLDKDYFSHDSPDGSGPSDRMVRAGYAPCGRTYLCGENLAVGASYPSTPDELFEGLMNSPGHRENILREEFREVGIGAQTGAYETYDGDASMYTMDFGGPP